MTIKQYQKSRNVILLADTVHIHEKQNFSDKRKHIYMDDRTFFKDGFWYVYPIGKSKDNKSIDIICPYCGKIHRHGNLAGHRVSHCDYPQNDNQGYVIWCDKAKNTDNYTW